MMKMSELAEFMWGQVAGLIEEDFSPRGESPLEAVAYPDPEKGGGVRIEILGTDVVLRYIPLAEGVSFIQESGSWVPSEEAHEQIRKLVLLHQQRLKQNAKTFRPFDGR